MSSSEKRFLALRQRWIKAHAKARELRFNLRYRYGDNYHVHAPRGLRDKADKASAAEERAMEAIFAWLDAHSPRDFRRGVPAHWVCESLSYADATTRGQLSVTPPVAYGCLPSDSVRFAAAIPQEREVAPTW